MSGNGKRYDKARGLVDGSRHYLPVEAIGILKELPAARFDETVELALNLGIDPRKADQLVRGTVSLPNGTDGACASRPSRSATRPARRRRPAPT